MSQNLQNFQNHCLAWAAAQPRSRRKAAVPNQVRNKGLAFPDQEKWFCWVLLVL
jgi:hypothetical protein